MNKILAIIIAVLIGLSGFLYKVNQIIYGKYEVAMSNLKAYESEFNQEQANSRVYKLTIEQLNYSKDSIIQKLKKTQKELGIKDSKIKQLQYNASSINKRDTLRFQDTIFLNPEFSIDTVLWDKWIDLILHLEYPNTIGIDLDVELESSVFLVSRKETIQPPRKFFLWRWFQRKHTVLEAIVKEENPYVRNKEYKVIQIIE